MNPPRLTAEQVEASAREMWDAIAHLPAEDEDRAAVIDEARRIEARLRIRLAAQERLDRAAPALLAVAKKCVKWCELGSDPSPILAELKELQAAIAIAEGPGLDCEADQGKRHAEALHGKIVTCPKCGEVSYVK